MKNYGRKTENEERRMKDSYRLSFYSPFSIFHSPLYIIGVLLLSSLFSCTDMVPTKEVRLIDSLNGKAYAYRYRNLDSSYKYAEQAYSKVNFYKSGKAEASNNLGICAFMNMDFGGNNLKGMMQAYADDYWSESNRNIYATFPRLSTTDIANNNRNSTWWLRDGSYLRLKSVEIGYTLPKRLTSHLGMSNLRIYASGLNLFAWNRFKLWDVEQGNDGMQYPIQAVYNFGINLSF